MDVNETSTDIFTTTSNLFLTEKPDINARPIIVLAITGILLLLVIVVVAVVCVVKKKKRRQRFESERFLVFIQTCGFMVFM